MPPGTGAFNVLVFSLCLSWQVPWFFLLLIWDFFFRVPYASLED